MRPDRGMGGFVDGAGHGADSAIMCPLAVTFVVSRGERHIERDMSANGGGSSGQLGGRVCLRKKVAKPGKFSERFVGDVGGVIALDDYGDVSSCCNDCIGRSDDWG